MLTDMTSRDGPLLLKKKKILEKLKQQRKFLNISFYVKYTLALGNMFPILRIFFPMIDLSDFAKLWKNFQI